MLRRLTWQQVIMGRGLEAYLPFKGNTVTAGWEWRDLGLQTHRKLFQGQARMAEGMELRGWVPEILRGGTYKCRWLAGWLWGWVRRKRQGDPSGFWFGQVVIVSSTPGGNLEQGQGWIIGVDWSTKDWNVPGLIPLGFSPLQTFFRVMCCEILGAS